MIRHDEKQGLVVADFERLPQRLVHLGVEPGEKVALRGGQFGRIERMPGIQRAPEGVRILVEAGKIEEEKPLLEAGQFLVVKPLALAEYIGCLPAELTVVQHAGGEGAGVLRHALRVEAPRAPGQIGAEGVRRGDGQDGVGRVDVHGGDVEFEGVPRPLEEEAADAVGDGQVTHHLEAQRNPVAPVSLLQDEVAGLDADADGGMGLVDGDGEGNVDVRALGVEGVDGAGETRIDKVAADVDTFDTPAREVARALADAVGEEREDAVGAVDVGCAKPRQCPGLGGNGREVGGNA